MSEHLHDDEQVEALKRWWQENGKSTIAAVVLAIGGTFGWQQYEAYSANQTSRASDIWMQALAQLESGQPAQVAMGEQLAEELKATASSSTYAQFAAMKLAAIAVSEGDFERAETELRWALAQGDSQSELGQLQQLRLARVLAAAGDEAAALTILRAGSDVYASGYATAEGDIHLAAGREQEALDAYRRAREAGLELGTPPGLLETKITSLESRLANTGDPS